MICDSMAAVYQHPTVTSATLDTSPARTWRRPLGDFGHHPQVCAAVGEGGGGKERGHCTATANSLVQVKGTDQPNTAQPCSGVVGPSFLLVPAQRPYAGYFSVWTFCLTQRCALL